MHDLDLPDIPGGWVARDVIVQERVFDLLLPGHPDAFLNAADSLATLATEERTTYWQYLWPTAIDMAQLVLRGDWKLGLAALELGAGIGLVGVAALAAGLNVTFSDCNPMAVQVALRNARRNGFAHATGLLLDWRVPVSQRFPVILASDVLYRPENVDPLLRVIDEMLDDGGVCWIGDPGRPAVRDFVQRASDAGFGVRLRDASGRDVLFPPVGSFVLVELRHLSLKRKRRSFQALRIRLRFRLQFPPMPRVGRRNANHRHASLGRR